NVRLLVTLLAQETRHLLQVDNGVQVARALLGPVATVQIASDGGVLGIPSQLANVIDVMDDSVQADHRPRSLRPPSWIKHPVIAGRADDRASFDEALDLVIVDLTVAGNDRTTAIVAGEYSPAKQFRGLP